MKKSARSEGILKRNECDNQQQEQQAVSKDENPKCRESNMKKFVVTSDQVDQQSALKSQNSEGNKSEMKESMLESEELRKPLR